MTSRATPAAAVAATPASFAPAWRRHRLGLASLMLIGACLAWGAARAQVPAQATPAASERATPSVTERREAAAAAAEGRRGHLADQGQDYHANALQRCARLPADQRSDCESRVGGAGQASGSVSGGGILRSTETTAITPAKPAVQGSSGS
ncbi:MAG: hypothetical protein QM617_08325 [Comamonas sp.]